MQDLELNYSKYWDIDDFLAEDETVCTQFQCSSFRNSDLNTHSQQVEGEYLDIEQGDIIDLPLWIAIKLCQSKIVKIEVPRTYGQKFKNTLIADPTVVNLREKNTFYYEVGLKLSEFIQDDELIKVLFDVFLERAKYFAKISYHLQINNQVNLLKKMANLEIIIFNIGRQAAMSFRSYKEILQVNQYGEHIKKLKSIKSIM